MKKFALFAAALCCLVSASAQHLKNEPMAHKTREATVQQVEILTLNGQQVVVANDSFESIHVSHLAAGCYLLKATFDDGSKAVQRFVKQ